MLTKIMVDSVDVTSYCVNWTFEKTFGDLLSEISINFNRNIFNATTLAEGLTLEVWRGWTTSTDDKVFSGYIEKYEPESGLIAVTGIDKMWDLVRKEVTKIYDSSLDPSAGKISEIFKDLVETYGGLTASVQDSGTTLVLSKFVCNHADIFERCKKLANMLNWQFYYSADDDVVYFEPKGFDENANVLTVGTDIMTLPKWQNDITEMTNDVTIVGAYQEVETTKSGRIGTTTGFATTGIDLDYVPISVKVYGDASNPPTTLKTGGNVDATSTYDYYVDVTQKKIYPAPGTTFTSGHYYEVRYSLAAPIPVNLYDQVSIDTYGLFKKTITYDDIKNIADAEARATNYLSKYGVPFVFATLRVKSSSIYNLDAGQNIHVVDNITVPHVDGFFVINKIRYKYPASYEEIDIGDSYWRLADFNTTVMEKFKRQEEQEFENIDILNQVVGVNDYISNTIDIAPRYNKILYQTAYSDALLWGNADYGTWGTQYWGGSVAGFSDEIMHSLQQYNNIYQEEIVDSDFFNTASTCTFDYTNNEVRF